MKNIVLFCSAGMSTSLLVEKMKAAAKELNYDCEIKAYAISKVKEFGNEADIILLGPQIRFNLNDVKKKCPAIPVEVIDMRDYGTMNGENVIRHVIETLNEGGSNNE